MKRLFILLLFCIMLTVNITAVFASPGQSGNFFGSSTSYKVTVSKVEISQDNSTWVTIGQGAQEFDIASVSVGAQVGSYVSNPSIPAGTYRYVRVTVSRTMKILGSGTNTSNDTYYTTTQTFDVGGGALGIASASSQAEATILIPESCPSPNPARESLTVSGSNLIVTFTLEEPFTVTASGGTLHVNFMTRNTIEFDPNERAYPTPAFYPIPPHLEITYE